MAAQITYVFVNTSVIVVTFPHSDQIRGLHIIETGICTVNM